MSDQSDWNEITHLKAVGRLRSYFWDDTKGTRAVEVVEIEDYSDPWRSEVEGGSETLLTGRDDG